MERARPGVPAARWRRLSLDEQIANLGVDVSRAVEAAARGDGERMSAWLAAARVEFAMTLADKRWSSADVAETARMRGLAEDYLVGGNAEHSTPSPFEDWWMPAAIRANEARSARLTSRS